MKYTLIRPLTKCQLRRLTGEPRPRGAQHDEGIEVDQLVFSENGREYWSDGRVAFSMKTTLPEGTWSRSHLEAAAKGWGFEDRLAITEEHRAGPIRGAEEIRRAMRREVPFKASVRFRVALLRRALELMEAAGVEDVAMHIPEDVRAVRIVPIVDLGMSDPECVVMPIAAEDRYAT